MSRTAGALSKPKRALLALLKERYPGYHPVLEMARIAHETDDITLEAQMHKEIAQYVEPKRKAVEITGNVTSSLPEMLATLPSATEDNAVEEGPDKIRH